MGKRYCAVWLGLCIYIYINPKLHLTESYNRIHKFVFGSENQGSTQPFDPSTASRGARISVLSIPTYTYIYVYIYVRLSVHIITITEFPRLAAKRQKCAVYSQCLRITNVGCRIQRWVYYIHEVCVMRVSLHSTAITRVG